MTYRPISAGTPRRAPYQGSSGTPGALVLSLRLSLDGDVVARERARESDLAEHVAEAWREGHLRAGELQADPSRLERRLRMSESGEGGGSGGFVLETRVPGGSFTSTAFSVASLGQVASRAAERLIDEGRLVQGDVYYYDLSFDSEAVDGDVGGEGRPEPGRADFKMESRAQPLDVLPVRLAGLLEVATPVGPHPSDQFPVFFTAAALRKSEALSRKGGRKTPPEESGGVLVGPLCSCPETGELAVVVCEVLEAVHADQSTFSLAYSGRSWSRIQTIVGAMRQQPSMREYRIVGQCHGHNFLPADGAPPCEACSSLERCSRTSVFVSSDDLNWSRAVFARQPWSLCQIYGWNARQEPVDGLFGVRDGQLLERGYYVIPDFHPTEWVV